LVWTFSTSAWNRPLRPHPEIRDESIRKMPLLLAE